MDGPGASIHSHKRGQCLVSQRHHLLMSHRSRGYAAAAYMEWLPILTSQSKMCLWGRITIASKSGIPELWSGFEISIKSPYPQVDPFQVRPFGSLLFREPEKRPAFCGALFSGCAEGQ